MQSHRYLIEPLAGDHAQAMLVSRFVKFIQNIQKSPKLATQFMLQKVVNNVNTVTGRNIRLVKDMIGHDFDILTINPTWLKKKIKFNEIGDDQKWRINVIKEIVNINQKVLELTPTEDEEDSFLTSEELQDILDFVSSS